MEVIGVLSRKGGVGKTTLATHLVVMAELAGRRGLLIDTDPQRSATAWWRLRDADSPQLVETTPGELKDVLEAAVEDGVEVAVVDARPSVEADVTMVATLSDLVVVPTRPAVFDLRAIIATLDTVQTAAKRALIVLNGCPPPRGAGEASVVVDARRALSAFGVPVAPVAIIHRSAFPAAALAGLAAVEMDPTSKAAKEMHALWRAVDKELSNGKANAARRSGKERSRGGNGTEPTAGTASPADPQGGRRAHDHLGAAAPGGDGGAEGSGVPPASAGQ
jgi:chromosome partitioning protein